MNYYLIQILKSNFAKSTLLITLSGALYSLAVPGGGLPWLAFICLVPLFYGFSKKSATSNALAWGIAMLISHICVFYWIFFYIHYSLSLSLPLSILISLISFATYTIPFPIGAYIFNKFSLFSANKGAFTCAAILTALIAIAPTPFMGDITISMYRTPIMLQIIEIGGGFLLLFILISINALIAQALLSYKQTRAIPKTIWISLLALTLFPLSYGFVRLSQFEKIKQTASSNQFLKVGYVQPNIPGKDLSSIFGTYLDSDERTNSHYKSTITTTRQMVSNNKGLDFIVWPETPKDFPYPLIGRDASILAESAQAPLFFSAMNPWSGYRKKPYTTGLNTLHRFNPDESISHPYEKTNLIPFSEYIPGERRFPWLRKLFPNTSDVTPGNKKEIISVGDKSKIIPLICYDGIFPSFVRDFAKKGGNILLTLDNDTNFGPTRAAELHFSAEIFRVLEHRMPLIRVTNAGVSLLVHASGIVDPASETPMYKKAYRVVNFLPGDGGKTPYQMGGFAFPWALGILSVFAVWHKKSALNNKGAVKNVRLN